MAAPGQMTCGYTYMDYLHVWDADIPVETTNTLLKLKSLAWLFWTNSLALLLETEHLFINGQSQVVALH